MKKSSASSQPGNLRRVNANSIQLTNELKAELSRTNRPDSKIDLSDMPELTSLKGAVRGQFFRPIKKPISLRVDADVIAWFKSLDGKYQSKMNEALREYMEHHVKSA